MSIKDCLLNAEVMEKYLNLIRIKQWIKNGIVFVPLMFSGSFTNITSVFYSVLIFFVFCLCASGVYIANDINDLRKDKLHPKKKNRPLVRGEISINNAKILASFLYILSILLALTLGLKCFAAVILYIILNYFYTKYFKAIPILDVICISMGFILRVLAGCYAISVEPSIYIIFATFFISLFFGFYKRILEINLNDNADGEQTRDVLSKYTKNSLECLIVASAVLFIAFYVFYTIETSFAFNNSGATYLYLSVLPLVYIIFRLIYLLGFKVKNDDPSEFFYTDKHINIPLALYILMIVCFLIPVL